MSQHDEEGHLRIWKVGWNDFRSLVVFTFAVGSFLAACATLTPEEEAAQLAKEELQEEIDTGRLIAAKLIGKFGLDESVPALNEYVNLVGRTIAERYGRSQLKYRFAILNSKDINALAAPGGYVFVTRGLLDQLKNEAELAIILGHEVGHVNEKHVFKQIHKKKKKSDAGFILARLLSRGAGDVGAAVQAAVNEGVALLVEKGLDPKLERIADEAGIYFGVQMGYRPHALREFLERIDQDTKKFPDTHPPAKQRLEALQAYVKKNALMESYQNIPSRTKLEAHQRDRFQKYFMKGAE